MQFKTYEVTLTLIGKKDSEKVIISDTSEQKIYKKFLRLGIIAKDFKQVQINSSSTGEHHVINLH